MGFTIEEAKRSAFEAKIKVIGVGGGGGNMIDHIVREGAIEELENLELISANTDAQALINSKAHTTIQLGERTSGGLGAGARPEMGKKSAEESYEEITKVLDGANLVFISAGFGGGTGTGAAPVIAKAAKEVGAFTIAIVTTPFKIEMKKRMNTALEGLKELRKECDSIIVIPNEKLRSVAMKGAGIKDAFKIVDEVLSDAVSGMCAVILKSGESDINIDFNDVKTAMSHRGSSLLCMGKASGEGSAQEAVKNATQSPLLDDIELKGARGLIANCKMHPSHPFDDVYEAMEFLNGLIGDDGEDPDVFFGTWTDSKMPEDAVEVTIIATGLDGKEEKLDKPEPQKLQKTGTDDLFSSFYSTSPSRKVDLDKVDLDQPAYIRRQQD